MNWACISCDKGNKYIYNFGDESKSLRIWKQEDNYYSKTWLIRNSRDQKLVFKL
jgi:hypothetical protein